MNAQYLDQGRAAYRSGDFSAAVQMLAAAKQPGELLGEADHLRGNALMRLGMYREAASAYSDALSDTAYGKQGALLTNQGKALAAAKDFAGAVNAFSAATRDASYATPYKAFLGLGSALMAQGDISGAGVAFRSAAIDGTNPAPAGALSSLGDCFLKLGRPSDAVEAYRTALDYAGAHDDPRSINAGLGQALAACDKPSDAVDAFQAATSDGIYQLSDDQQQAFASARDEISARNSMLTVSDAGAVQQDPLDPMGQTGNFMPDPSDTGFFTLSESEMIQQDKRDMKVRRKHRHVGLKVFLVVLIVLALCAGGLGFAYTRGLGFPSQQDALTGLFDAVTNGSDASEYLSPALSDDAKSVITSSIPQGATATISSMDKGMTSSTATVTVQLSKGGTQTYQVEFDRASNHIGWAVKSVSIDFGSAGTSSDSSDSASVSDGASDSSTDDSDASQSESSSTDAEQSDASSDGNDTSTDAA